MADESQRAARLAAGGSMVLALVAFSVISSLGHPRFAIALAGGMVIGSVTGVLVLRTLELQLPFRLSSLARLGVQSALAVALGLVLGADVVWVPALGMALASAVLGSFALRGALTR
jgi:hypothetical protein